MRLISSAAKFACRMFFLFVIAAFFSGCSGINYTHGVSPATFLLPGLMQHEPVSPNEISPVFSTNQLAVLLTR